MAQRQPEPAWPEGSHAGAEGDPLPTVHSLEELAALIDDREDLYLRWSRGPDADRDEESRDALTGTPLPGLSANTLAVEPWWGDRSLTLWAARRIYDYQHLEERRPGDYRPWVLSGKECGRGPDNEPLVENVQPVAWIAPEVSEDARTMIESLPRDWGTLGRAEAGAG